MKTLIVIMTSLSMIACSPSGGGGSGSGGGSSPNQTVAKNCSSTLQRAWVNTQSRFAYEFNSNCSGAIPSCGAVLDYEIIEIDGSGGTISLSVTASTPGSGCPVAGDTATCTFDYDIARGSIQGMDVRCNGGATVYYTPSYGTP